MNLSKQPENDEEQNGDEYDQDTFNEKKAKSLQNIQVSQKFFNFSFRKRLENSSLNICSVANHHYKNSGVQLKQENKIEYKYKKDAFSFKSYYKNSTDNQINLQYTIQNLYESDFISVSQLKLPILYKNNFTQWQINPSVSLVQGPYKLEIESNAIVNNNDDKKSQTNLNATFFIKQNINENYQFLTSIAKRKEGIIWKMYHQYKPSRNFLFNLDKVIEEFERGFQIKELQFRYQQKKKFIAVFQYFSKENKFIVGLDNFKTKGIQYGGRFSIIYGRSSLKNRQNSNDSMLNDNTNDNNLNQNQTFYKNPKTAFVLYFNQKKSLFGDIQLTFNEKTQLTVQKSYQPCNGVKFNTIFTTQLLDGWRPSDQYPLKFNLSMER